jgi:hypothetical protein
MARLMSASKLWSLPGIAEVACAALGGEAGASAAWAVGVGAVADDEAGDAASAGGRAAAAGIGRAGGIPTAGAETWGRSTARSSEVGWAIGAFASFGGEVGAGAIALWGTMATEWFALADWALRIAKNMAATNAPNAMPAASATQTVAPPFFCSAAPAMLVGLVVSSGNGAGRGRTRASGAEAVTGFVAPDGHWAAGGAMRGAGERKSGSIGAVDTGAGMDPGGRWLAARGAVSTGGGTGADETPAEGAAVFKGPCPGGSWDEAFRS